MVLLLCPLSCVAQAKTCDTPFLFEPKPLPTPSKWMEGWGVKLQATPEFIQLDQDAELLDARLWLRADHLYWDRVRKRLKAKGHLRGQTPQWLFTASELNYDQQQKTLAAQDITFQSAQKSQRGTAASLKEKRKQKLTLLKAAKLTTCPLGNDDWYLHAKKVRVDKNAQRVYAHHAWVDFKGMPLFYTPYISYPLSNRASGFLMPSFSQYQSPNREDASWIVGIPYYFNIAPNYDDTLTLYQMQDRGSLLDNEFRSLNTWQKSTLTTSWISDELTREHRWRIKLVGTQTWRPTLTSEINWQRVSDRDFYSDLPLDTALTTASYAQQHIRLNWQPDNHFNAYLLHQDYLLLRSAGTYYEKRPELGFDWHNTFSSAVRARLSTQSTNFDIPVSGHNKPEGWRHVLAPSITGNWVKPWGQYGMTVQLQSNHYQLRNHPEATPEFHIPMGEVHAQVIFERPAEEWGAGWLQTFEPKIQFTYIPLEKQQLNAPNFDSGVRTLNFENLFALNRFTGQDRIGDTQRLSLALTSRLYTAHGKERARLAVGQAFYLAKRHISLTGLQEDTSPRSNYFAQLRIQSPWLMLDNTAELHQQTAALTNLNSRLRLQLKQLIWRNQYIWEKIDTPNESQRLLSGVQWQLKNNWHVGTFWHYDFTHSRRIETLSALGYESCCWKTEIQLTETQLLDGRYNYSVRLTLTLKGLSTVGQTFSQQLDDKLNF